MAKAKAVETNASKKRMRPALSPEARENQLISLAYDLVEERLRNGTATSQETTHFLKRGSEKDRLEMELLAKQVELAAAKAEAIKSAKDAEERYNKAIKAMQRYSGNFRDEDI